MARSSNSAFAIFAALCIALFLVAQLASAAPLAKRQPGGGGRGGGQGGPMGPPPDGGNGTRPDFNGTRPDFNGTHGGPGGPGGPRGPRFGVPVDKLLSSVSAGCSSAANSTSGFDVCRPDNSTMGSNSTKDAGNEAQCSTACSDAVKSYFTALKTACGSEPLITETPRNASAFNLTATDVEGAALVELALGCAKDLSGNYCGGGPRGGRGGPGGPGGHHGGPDGDRPPMNGTDAPTGTDAPAQPTQALRKRQPPSDAGSPPTFNSTICAECTQSQLSAISTLESERPTQTFFGRKPEITSWALLKEDISGRCDKIASMIASATAMPTGTAPPTAQETQAA